jgi:hypothetical protein
VNQGFVANCTSSKRFPSQVYQLILNFIVTKYDEATFLATEGMLQGETAFTHVTAFWKVWWCDGVPYVEGILKLLGREFGPVDGGGEHRQPSTHLLSFLDIST